MKNINKILILIFIISVILYIRYRRSSVMLEKMAYDNFDPRKKIKEIKEIRRSEIAEYIIIAFEGFSSVPYADPPKSNTWSIGYGTFHTTLAELILDRKININSITNNENFKNLDNRTAAEKIKNMPFSEAKNVFKISESTARTMLRIKLDEIEKQIKIKYPNLKITQNMYDALLSFAYNAGIGSLDTLLKGRIRKDNTLNLVAIHDIITFYSFANKKFILALYRRREIERDLFFGQYYEMLDKLKKINALAVENIRKTLGV